VDCRLVARFQLGWQEGNLELTMAGGKTDSAGWKLYLGVGCTGFEYAQSI
jgi:hypothetical protein